jgi:hypothetical protein
MKVLITVLAAAALTVGCGYPEVRYDYDLHANYAGFHTFDWYAAPKEAKAGHRNPMMDARVTRAVEAEMASKGIRRETAADPDFYLTYYPAYEPVHRSRVHVGLGFGMGPVGVGVAAPVSGAPRGAVGSIVLEVQDFKTHQMVWRAVAKDILDESLSPEDAEADIAKAVKKMLTKFPPATAAP